VYPTVVICADDWDQVYEAANRQIAVYFELRRICSCSTLFEAVCTLFFLYYVFDIQFPKELKNTMNFLDVYLTKLSAGKVVPCVQRKLNVLLSCQ